jgi:hypothetical protein
VPRGKLLYVAAGAVAVVAAVALLRSQTPIVESVVAPDGQQLSAFHDPRLIVPPDRPGSPPRPPSELRLDPRLNGTLVSWAAAPFGFEVRWGRVGGELDQVSYHATSGTTLRGLSPGRYRVEVRSVDGIGQRSTPVTAEFEASGRHQEWERGLGFAVDFGRDPRLDPVDWRLSDIERGCLLHDGAPDPVLMIPSGCGFGLRPAAPLRLGAELAIIASPSPTTSFSFMEPPITDGTAHQRFGLPSQAIAMRVTGVGVGFELGEGLKVTGRDTGEYRPPTAGVTSPGALHRWELVFCTDRIEAVRDGVLVASAPVTAPWREAQVNITTGYDGFGGRLRDPAQVSFVGITGEVRDARPVRVVDLENGGSVEHTAGAVAARLSAVTGRRYQGTPEPLVASVQSPPGAPPVAVDMHPLDADGSAAYVADLPAALLGDRLWVALRAPAAAMFFERLVLELTYPAGTQLRVAQPTAQPQEAAMPRLVLQARSPDTNSVLSEGQRTKPTRHSVRLAVFDRAEPAGVVPWVALQVDIDGRRVLTMPTSAAGPAIATQYEFVVDLGNLPLGEHTLVATLVPDRKGIEPATTQTRFQIE